MPVIEDIRLLDRSGIPGRTIARKLGVSRDSVAKYTKLQDCSPPRPQQRTYQPRPALAAVIPIIDGILEADKNAPRKQRHTAKRIWERLVAEHSFTGSYRVVSSYIQRWKQARQTQYNSFAELDWAPGSAQVDFGKVEVNDADGAAQTLSMLVVSFPFSNARYAQIYQGENAECVCHGLRTIFGHLGFAPKVMVFDNATGIGRRIAGKVTESTLFSRFRAHYRFESRFCNPYSGNEKGSVENAVGFLRRNLLVPVPRVTDMEVYNRELLARCDELLEGSHYRKHQPIQQLLAMDRVEGLGLPDIGFTSVRFDSRRADREGRVKIDGNYYLVGPGLHGQEITVGIGHDQVEFFDREGRSVRMLPRCYQHSPTTITDPQPLLSLLATRAGAWRESPIRPFMPAEVVMWMDTADFADKQRALRHLDRVCAAGCGFEETMTAAQQLIARGDRIDEAALTLLAKRSDLTCDTNPAIDLGVYDLMLHNTSHQQQCQPPPQSHDFIRHHQGHCANVLEVMPV